MSEANSQQGLREPGDEAGADDPQAGEALCPRCGGTGKLEGAACPGCGGDGRIVQLLGDA